MNKIDSLNQLNRLHLWLSINASKHIGKKDKRHGYLIKLTHGTNFSSRGFFSKRDVDSIVTPRFTIRIDIVAEGK